MVVPRFSTKTRIADKKETMHDRFLKALLFAMLCIMLGALTATAHAQSQGSWMMKAPIPLARNEVTLAAVGGKIHVIGGSVEGVAGGYPPEKEPRARRRGAR